MPDHVNSLHPQLCVGKWSRLLRDGVASSHDRGPGKGCKIFGLDELEIGNALKLLVKDVYIM